MANEPTLYHGDEGKDGWVEYLQTLLAWSGDLDPTNSSLKHGKFDDKTLAAVKQFQTRMGFDDTRGIVGDQTWSALRGEETIRPAGDDGRAPHTYQERGMEMRFTNQITYMEDFDRLFVEANSVGDAHPAEGTIKPFIVLQRPDGTSLYPTAKHLVISTDGLNQGFHVDEIAGTNGNGSGKTPGLYSILIQLPQETGGDTCEFQFNIRDDGTVDEPVRRP
jgi:hypothetical protein